MYPEHEIVFSFDLQKFQVPNSYTKVKFGLIVEINDFFVIILAIQTNPAKNYTFLSLIFNPFPP